SLLGGALALAQRFLVLRSAFGHDDDLTEAAFSDAHRRNALVPADADVDRPAVAAVHRVERDRASALDRALDYPLGNPFEVPLAGIGTPLYVQHHSTRRFFVATQEHLVGEELERVDRARLAAREHFGRRALDLDHCVGAILTLSHRERSHIEPLDRALH